MIRDRHETVTGVVLLIPTSRSEAMGEATFLSETFGPSHVRPITLDEVKAIARKLRDAEAARFDALLSMKRALESCDHLALVRAKERMERFYELSRKETVGASDPYLDPIVERVLAPKVGLTVAETYKYIFGLRSGPNAAANPQRLLSYEVSALHSPLSNAQSVLWWIQGALRPAIYCPDPMTALYIHTFFLAPVGGVGFRICPYDGKQFFQDRPNQEYCCPAHREAHRVARFRDKKKRSAQRGKDSKSHGAQKTR